MGKIAGPPRGWYFWNIAGITWRLRTGNVELASDCVDHGPPGSNQLGPKAGQFVEVSTSLDAFTSGRKTERFSGRPWKRFRDPFVGERVLKWPLYSLENGGTFCGTLMSRVQRITNDLGGRPPLASH